VTPPPLTEEQANAFMSQLIDSVFAAVKKGINPADRPPALFHFTDVSGLLAIVKSNTIWASLAYSLNDAAEVQYGVELAKQLIENGGLTPNSVLLRLGAWYLDPMNSPPGAQMRWQPFVASFCASEASAMHWLDYGHRGTGVAIGLDSARLVFEPFELVKVVYDAGEQRELIQASIDRLVQKLEEVQPGASEDPQHPLFHIAAHIIAQAINGVSARFKAPAFAAEQEWRLMTWEIEGIVHPPGGVNIDIPTKLRTRESRLIAYKEAAYDPLPVAEIVFGNACATDPSDYAVQVVLAPGVPCRRSGVPVRP